MLCLSFKRSQERCGHRGVFEKLGDRSAVLDLRAINFLPVFAVELDDAITRGR